MWKYLIPRSWRDTVVRDLDDEARMRGRGAWWVVGQALWVGTRLRPAVNGDAMWSDLQYAVRSLWRSKLFAAGALLTFALGIGVNVAVFTVVDRMLLRPLPYGDADRLVVMGEYAPGATTPYGTLTPSHVLDARDRHTRFVDLATIEGQPLGYTTTAGAAADLAILEASHNLLSVLGVDPLLGRGFTREDVRAGRRGVLLTFEAWQARFGGRTEVVGETIWRQREAVTILGVLPEGFFLPPASVEGRTHGLGLNLQALRLPTNPREREYRPYIRLTSGASLASAEAELNALLGGADARPAGEASSFRLVPIREAMFGRHAPYAWLVIMAASLVLLMCCANLASLMLVRARSRQRWTSLRMALGASRFRIVRSAVLESLLLAGAGTVAALLAVGWTHTALRAFVPEAFRLYAVAPTDGRVLAFALFATVVSALIAGVWPTMRTLSMDVSVALRRSSRHGGSSRGRSVGSVLVAEALVAVLLIAGAAMTARSLITLMRTDLGFKPDGLYFVGVGLTPPPVDAGERFRLQREVLEAIRSTTGVEAAAAADVLPILRMAGNLFVRGERDAFTWRVTDRFFETMGMPVLAGRVFTEAEVARGASVSVLSERGLVLVWPGASPGEAVGRVLHLEGLAPAEVIGVVGDVRGTPAEAPDASQYLPLTVEGFRNMRFIARTADGGPLPADELRQRVMAFATPGPVGSSPVSAGVTGSLRDQRFRAILFGAFAGTALLLAVVGLYAVTAFEVRQRQSEMGIRLALGATPAHIRHAVLRLAVWPVALGSAIGLLIAWWAGAFLQSFLHQVDARDPATLMLGAGLLVLVAIVAAWLPAREASRVDPATVLRSE